MTARQGAAAPNVQQYAHGQARGKALALLAVAALGVVYGDIGTYPLYALLPSLALTSSRSPMAALIIYAVMTTWKRGTWLVVTRERSLDMTLPRFLQRVAEEPPVRIEGDAVFLSANRDRTPAALLANLKYNRVLHERVLLLNVQYAEVPYIDADQRIELEHLGYRIYRATFHYGFMEEADVPHTLQAVDLQGKPFAPGDVPFFVNRTKVAATDKPGMAPWREHLYTFMRRNAASAAAFCPSACPSLRDWHDN